jgi:hypothetical protein
VDGDEVRDGARDLDAQDGLQNLLGRIYPALHGAVKAVPELGPLSLEESFIEGGILLVEGLCTWKVPSPFEAGVGDRAFGLNPYLVIIPRKQTKNQRGGQIERTRTKLRTTSYWEPQVQQAGGELALEMPVVIGLPV